MRALVVGGTGPTGPHVVEGLLQRGFAVTLFHRGVHEPPGLAHVEHVHGDPHFTETIEEALGDAQFDVVLAMYGRVRLLVDVLADRCGQFIAVGGVPVYAGYYDPHLVQPSGLALPVGEDHPLADTMPGQPSDAVRFQQLLVRTERAVLDRRPDATIFRYPMIYGPRSIAPREWSVIKRVLDRRPHMIVPDRGLSVHSRCAARNAAAFLLAAVDHPQIAAGRVYNCGDETQFTLGQWIELVLDALDAELELVDIPSSIALEAQANLMPIAGAITGHALLDITRAKTELGYRDVVEPGAALAETVQWYVSHPVDLANVNVGFSDRFDYAAEDALIAAYRAAVAQVSDAAPQVVPRARHGMPHPKRPGERVQRGR